MLNDNSYRNEDIYASIKELSKQKSNLYDKGKLEKVGIIIQILFLGAGLQNLFF